MRGGRELEALRVQAVANLNLPRNAAKCHWLNLSAGRLLWLLVVEVWELVVAVWRLRKARKDFRYAAKRCHPRGNRAEQMQALRKARADVRHEVGDVACFAMMIADRCGALIY